MSDSKPREPDKAPTGVDGVDVITGGGLPFHRLYLVKGAPGVGKTTFGLQFLRAGTSRNEKCLYVTLSESQDELNAIARSHGWNLDQLNVHEVSMKTQGSEISAQYSVFHPAEVELGAVMKDLLAVLETQRPHRLVIDSLSEMRLLAGDPLRYRRQILALREFLQHSRCTTLLLDTNGHDHDDQQSIDTLAYGVIELDHFVPTYGRKRRRVRIAKMRGVNVDDGYHDFKIQSGGLEVYPRLVASDHRVRNQQEMVPSDVPELDTMLGGGLTRGSSTLVMGAAGTGKTTLTMQYALAAAKRDERVAIYTFDESREMYLTRARGMGVDLDPFLKRKSLTIQRIDPSELTPGEFINLVRTTVDREQSRVVIIDSLNGYLHATPDERFLTVQLHELLMYMADRVILTMLVVAQEGLMGQGIHPPIEISYLADAVILLRYFEHHGQVRQAISVVKKRYGTHERTIRELKLGTGGVRVGQPLTDFQGILTGMPSYHGSSAPLLREGNA